MHQSAKCDACGNDVPEERLRRYDRNPNHECEVQAGPNGLVDPHYCSNGCYRSRQEVLD